MTDIEPGPDDEVHPAHKLALLVSALAAEGVGASNALAGVGISYEALGAPETRISLNQMIAGFRNALRLSKDPAFAYRLGLRCHAPAHGMYGFAILSSTDFRRAIDFAIDYRLLAAPLAQVTFTESSTSGVWTITPLAPASVTPELSRYFVEFHIGVCVTLHRDVMGVDFNPRQIRVTFDPPQDVAQYTAMFGCPVLFGQSENQVLFDVDWLDRVPELGNEETFGIVRGICDGLIEDLRSRLGLAGKIRQFLLANLMRSPCIGDVAKAFGLSERTLRRKLRDEDTTYSLLVDGLRRELAIKYLRHTAMTIDDIGYALGFSEPTNFRQAFRRWNGTTPREFRNAARAAV